VKVDAVIVAAGASTRFGDGDKLLVELAGRPVVAWSLAAYEACASVGHIIVVASSESVAAMASLAHQWAPSKFDCVVLGGARRRDSVEGGLHASKARYVAVHDGARPLVTTALIECCISTAEGKPGAISAVPVTDTIKEVDEGLVTAHPDRTRLWAAQTPQVILRQAWLDAAAAGDDDETDDAAMLSRLGLEVAVVPGDPENIKITRPLDLEVARLILGKRGAE
jgi:2-C-methyl-D-erythritol 4-phosphate cytidylyltransferase